MTARRAAAEDKVRPANRPSSHPDQLRQLGEAMAARCEDVWALCEARLEALGIAQIGTPEFSVRRRAAELRGAEIFARWLATGKESTVEERTWLGGLGELGAQTGVSISDMTRGYLIFRDVLRSIIDEEAERLEIAREMVEKARRVNLQSADSSILWMTRSFDRQTERQAAELAASEMRFRTVYESMGSGVAIIGPDGTVLEANDTALEMLELPRERFVGGNVLGAQSYYLGESGETLARLPTAEAVVTRKPVLGRVVKHDFGDGRPVRWHHVDAVPIFDGDGDLVQVLATITDVTAVKQAEELRAESAAKDRFLAAMSHELRTPLNSILGFAQLLEMNGAGKLDAKQMRYVHNISRSGQGLLKLISDILELSKSDPDEAVALADVPIAPLAREVLSNFEQELAGLPIEVITDFEPALKVRADRARLRQVLVNLVSNAVKFTSLGSITVSSRGVDDWVELRIADTGLGIAAADLERVFTEFTQLDSGVTRVHGGAGLGLAVSRRLCQRMGGRIHLESPPEGGVTAIIELQPV